MGGHALMLPGYAPALGHPWAWTVCVSQLSTKELLIQYCNVVTFSHFVQFS